MAKRSMSDIIEEYFKSILSQHNQIEIRRNEVAEYFDCVPSQINYVISTRFTLKQGYLVESKRGGGGYIRIKEVELLEDTANLDTIIKTIGNHITERDAIGLIDRVYREKLIQRNEYRLMISAIDRLIYDGLDEVTANVIRARLLKSFLINLTYD